VRAILTLAFVAFSLSAGDCAVAVEPYALVRTPLYGVLAGSVDSQIRLADEKAIMAAQAGLSPAALEQLRREDALRIELMTDPLNIALNAPENKALLHVLERTWATAAAGISGARQFWPQQRPFEQNDLIKDLASPKNSTPPEKSSFPAAHGAVYFALAAVLGMVNPEWRHPAFAQAFAISARRRIAGLHYQDDVNGGRDLAFVLLGMMQNDTAFYDDIKAARFEFYKKNARERVP
jgi:membrane-associated phospholipid phosphatase